MAEEQTRSIWGDGTMLRFISSLLFLALTVSGATAQIVRIAEDRGGRIGTYVDKYQNIRSSGDTVMIDGRCISACTIVLGAIDPSRICITERASLGFHAAWDFGANGMPVNNADATQMLFAMYPTVIKRWIAQRGGLTSKMLFLDAKSMRAMGYRPCTTRVPVYASAQPPQ